MPTVTATSGFWPRWSSGASCISWRRLSPSRSRTCGRGSLLRRRHWRKPSVRAGMRTRDSTWSSSSTGSTTSTGSSVGRSEDLSGRTLLARSSTRSPLSHYPPACRSSSPVSPAGTWTTHTRRRVPRSRCRRYPHAELGTLAERHGVLADPQTGQRVTDDDKRTIVDLLHARSNGNALYATYLCRHATGTSPLDPAGAPTTVAHLIERLREIPANATDLDEYYAHLLGTLTGEQEQAIGALALCDFALSRQELAAIAPLVEPWLDEALARLAPILNSTPGLGGLKVHHESFSRFIRRTGSRPAGRLFGAMLPTGSPPGASSPTLARFGICRSSWLNLVTMTPSWGSSRRTSSPTPSRRCSRLTPSSRFWPSWPTRHRNAATGERSCVAWRRAAASSYMSTRLCRTHSSSTPTSWSGSSVPNSSPRNSFTTAGQPSPHGGACGCVRRSTGRAQRRRGMCI